MKWKEVTKEEFFAAIAKLDVITTFITNDFPYSLEWKLRYGGVVGKTVDEFEKPNIRLLLTKYFLPEE